MRFHANYIDVCSPRSNLQFNNKSTAYIDEALAPSKWQVIALTTDDACRRHWVAMGWISVYVIAMIQDFSQSISLLNGYM